MCGICGILSFEKGRDYLSNVRSMNAAMSHRGPNAEGIWNDEHIVLGHRRLSIIDLSAAGNQPMVSADGRFVLVFNGEIYNYKELRQEINEYPFATNSDSEVILAAFQKWGFDCVTHFNGMFAFALWDSLKSELYLVRDRLGIKPLYYYADDHKLIFSSEIRTILASNLVHRKLDPNSLIDYIRYQTVHAPHTIVEGVKMLMPGQYMVIRNTKPGASDSSPGGETERMVFSDYHIHSGYYWQMGRSYTSSTSPLGKSKNEVQKDILELLSGAVARRLVADVPFGAFLSGGIDSSIVVGLMANALRDPVNTFSVTFQEKKFSESPYSQLIADRFNTRHTEIRLNPDDFLNMLPEALASMDHPSGDGPNTWVISRMTKEAGVTMAMSGLGGDELFAGYDVFKRLYYLNKFRMVGKAPLKLRTLSSHVLDMGKPSVPVFKVKELLQLKNWNFVNTYPLSRRILSDDTIRSFVTNSELPLNGVESIVEKQNAFARGSHFLSLVSEAEMATYMQNVLLRDTDQMSMAHALEVRVPFLDYQLVEYVLQVPDDYKYPHSPKQLLVESVGNLLPEGFGQRRKMGFTLPWNYWMRDQLMPFCEHQLKSLSKQEYFNSQGLMQFWRRFQNHDPLITWSRVWTLVALGNWLKANNIS